MKKLYVLAAAILCGIASNAQSFSDDFESYTVGNFLGSSSSNWTTWSGGSGGADDVKIVNDNSNSGSKSIYFLATAAAGGPDDVVLPFGGTYTTGKFQYNMMMNVASGNGAYFNLQAEETIGVTWAMECYMNQLGNIVLSNTNGTLLTGSYDVGQWFEIGFDVNLNTNSWELFIDSVSQGTFSNSINSVGAINIYAYNNVNGGNGSSSFWVDDVSYSYVNTALPNLNGAITGITGITGFASQVKNPEVIVRNLGQTILTSFDIDLTYDGSTLSESITGVSLDSYEEYAVSFDPGIQLSTSGTTIAAVLTSVNGQASDDDNTDDEFSTSVDAILSGLNKKVLVEEATGTWCGWCPRGAVWMETLQNKYPELFVGLAVHNGDPMTDEVYDVGIGTLISGYPSALVDRTGDVDPSSMEPVFLDEVILDAAAQICLSAKLPAGENLMRAFVEIVPTAQLSSNWRVAVALAENNVTGTASNYAQANYYSGGANGELTGAGHEWHNSPNPVPANQMFYDHVARAIAPSFEGLEGSFPEGAEIGNTYKFRFDIPLSEDWNLEEMHLIGMLINDQGIVDNANQVDIATGKLGDCGQPDTSTFVSNGLTYYLIDSDTFILWNGEYVPVGVTEAKANEIERLVLAPNPASSFIKINAILNAHSSNQLIVRDVMGRIVFQNQVQVRGGLYQLQLDLSMVNNGLYIVELTSGNNIQTKRFIKQ